jgi:hypothetical protein
MFRYMLHTPDGDDIGEAIYAVPIQAGGILSGNGLRLRQHRPSE